MRDISIVGSAEPKNSARRPGMNAQLLTAALVLVTTTSLRAQASAASPTPPAARPPAAPTEAPASSCLSWKGTGRDLHVAADQSDVTFSAGRQPCSLQVKDKSLRDTLKGLQGDDRIQLDATARGTTLEVADIRPQRDGAVGRGQRLLWLLLGFAVLTVAIRLTVGKDWPHLVLGLDGRYSKSKTQMAAWFGLLVITYLAAIIIRALSSGHFVGGVNIPDHLLLISGLSAFSFAGAKAITTQRQAQATAAAQTGRPGPLAKPVNPDPPSFLHDLVYNDDTTNPQPDLGDFQMLVATALALAVYLVAAFKFLGSMPLSTTVTLPDVDSTILAAFGLGQGAYLAKKAVS